MILNGPAAEARTEDTVTVVSFTVQHGGHTSYQSCDTRVAFCYQLIDA